MSSSLRLYWETARQLAPEQLGHQVRVRLARFRPASAPGTPPRPLVLNPKWGPRVERVRAESDGEVLAGRFRFWGQSRDLDLERSWEARDLGRSWNYPVHYFEAAPALAQRARDANDAPRARSLCRFFEQWTVAHPVGSGVAWEPYPTALRIVNWLDAVHTLGDLAVPAWRERILASLWVQAEWLSHRLERHLLGTHLLKDVKALLVAGSVFADRAAMGWRGHAEALLRRELARQIRDEGSHLEPSVMYHDVALEDLLDLLNFVGAASPELGAALEHAAGRMLGFAVAVQTPAGEYPLLGDAALGAAPSPRQLVEYAARLGLQAGDAVAGLRLFSGAGIAVWRDARQFLLADVGTVGPAHLAGHGHCDSLSFEWHVGGVPFVVDSGTLAYEPGPSRMASRGTRAHNTLEIDGREQHEIWAAFRVARRAAARSRQIGSDAVEAELTPWHDRSLRCVRRFEFGVQRILVQDRVEGQGMHRVTSRLHLHPDCAARLEGRTLRLQHGPAHARIVLPETPAFDLRAPADSGSFYCERFGEARPSWELHVSWNGPLPYVCELSLLPGAEGA